MTKRTDIRAKRDCRYPTLSPKVGNLACLNWDYVGTLSHDCFWMLKGLPLFSLTINCSDRKFEFQIIEYIPCTEISSIHAQVVLVIKVPATLPSWMKREEFIKMVSYRGVVWGIVDSCLLCPLGSKLQKQHGNTTKGVQVRNWKSCVTPIHYQVTLWPIFSEDFKRGRLLYFNAVSGKAGRYKDELLGFLSEMLSLVHNHVHVYFKKYETAMLRIKKILIYPKSQNVI